MASETSLSDLNIVYHSQILFDNVMLPLRIDIADITEIDYILAFSLTNPYKIKAVEQQLKEYNELEDIKTIYLTGDEMQMSYEQLQHQYELDVIEEDKKLDYCMKFINTTDKLFNGGTETMLEYVGGSSVKSWLLSQGINDLFFSNLYTTVSYWVDLITTEYTSNVKVALLLDNKDGVEMNYSLSRLKSCYDSNLHYFYENKDIRTFDSLSYREQHLKQSYATKMNYIDIAINKDAKKQIDDKRNDNAKPKKRGTSRSF